MTPDQCCTCQREAGWPAPLCAACGRTVCLSCATSTEAGPHCPDCLSDMAAFLADELGVSRAPQVLDDRQEQLSLPW